MVGGQAVTEVPPGQTASTLTPPGSRRWRVILPLLVGALIVALPVPVGLTTDAWRYFAVFVAVIVSLITEPVPGAVAG